MKMTDTEKSSVSEKSSPIKEPAVDVGGSVPFLNKPDLLDTIMCRQKIGPRCKLCLKFRVSKPEQEMRWRFRALKGKLTFAIYRQKITDTEMNTTAAATAAANEIRPEYNQLYATFGKTKPHFVECFHYTKPSRPYEK